MPILVEDGPKVDRAQWRYRFASHDKYGKPDPRVEVFKTTTGTVKGREYAPGHFSTIGGAQLKLVFRPDGTVMSSSNSRAQVSMPELVQVLQEGEELAKKLGG